MNTFEIVKLNTNFSNLELSYRKIEKGYSPIGLGIAISLSLVLYPLLVATGLLLSVAYTCQLIKSKWKSRQITNLLLNETNPNELMAYKTEKISKNKQKVVRIQDAVKSILQKNPSILTDLNLPAPAQKSWWGKFPQNYWEQFPWDDFNTKILEGKLNKNSESFNRLAIQYKRLKIQENCLNLDDVKMIRQIVLMKLIKNQFKGQQILNNLQTSALVLVPVICTFSEFLLNRKQANFQIAKSARIPKELANDSTYIEAHNRLIRENDFLVPFFPDA